MKNTKKFNLTALLMLAFVGVGFGQEKLDILSGGGTFKNPNLDPFLMQHSIYAETELSIYNQATNSPNGGIIGANYFRGGAKFTLCSDSAFIQNNQGTMGSSSTCKTYLGSGNAIQDAGSIPKNPVYDVGSEPMLPELDFSTIRSDPNVVVNPPRYGNNATLPAGVYYFTEDLVLFGSQSLEITPVDGSYKTIIYLEKRLGLYSNARLIPQGYVPGTNHPGEGQIMVISKSSDYQSNPSAVTAVPMAAIHFGWQSQAVGTFIAPYGGIYAQYEGKVAGQFLANYVRYIGGNFSGDFVFIPPSVVGIIARDHTFPEDKFWNFRNTGWGKPNDCDEPKYTDDAGRKWSATKNRDYDTNITISLSQPLSSGSISFNYNIDADNGIVATPKSDANKREARAYLEKTSGTIKFEGSTTKQTIPVKVIDFGDNKGNATFTVSFSGFVNNSENDVEEPEPITITILTDDPDGMEVPVPTFSAGDKIFEMYKDLGIQNIGELSSSYECEAEFEISSARIGGVDVSSWFEIVNGNEIKTTSKYNANFDAGQISLEMKFRTLLRGTKSEESEIFTVEINPWNTKPFDVKDYIAECEENSAVLLSVFESTVSDVDKPSNLNNQIIGGLTENQEYPTAVLQKNFAYSAAERVLTTKLGATVTVKDDKSLRYDLTGVKTTEMMDEFWYTAIDTADYGYATDIWVKSVKVVVYLNIDVPLPKGAYYYDGNGDGKVDSAVIEFSKEIEDMSVFKDFAIDFGSAQLKSFDLLNNTALSLLLDNAKQDLTSDDDGAMSIRIFYETTDESGNVIKPEIDVVASDRAAPVIVDDAIIIKSLSGGNDTLIIKFSEKTDNFGSIAKPFKFNKGKGGTEFDDIEFVSILTQDNVTFIVVISPANSGINNGISGGDWVFINSSAGITDDKDNPQEVYDNKAVEIKQRVRTKLHSAAFFDTDAVKDGYIDLISFDFGTEISMTLAERILDAVELPNNTNRKFDKVEEIKLITNGFEVKVKENRENPARTSINEFDAISINNIEDGALTIEQSKVVPKDRIAPVILYAQYTAEAQNYLDVVFSEEVSPQSGNPYKFYQIKPSPGRDYDMTFDAALPKQTENNILQYKVIGTGVPYPVGNDSIWIMTTGIIADKDDNVQDLTVRAPLKLTKPYPSDLELFVVPQPLHLINAGNGYEPKELPQSFMDFYKIHGERNGVAIVLEAKGPVSDPKLQRGVVKIVDQLGNTVTDALEMKFSINDRGTVSGVAVWSGKNRSGRTVAASTYLAIVDVEIEFDDRTAKESRAYKKVIAVTTAKDRFE